jgi:hypothetical protein
MGVLNICHIQVYNHSFHHHHLAMSYPTHKQILRSSAERAPIVSGRLRDASTVRIAKIIHIYREDVLKEQLELFAVARNDRLPNAHGGSRG